MSERFDQDTGEILDIPQHGQLLASAETNELWGALIEAQARIEPPQRTKEAKVEGISASGSKYEYKYKYAPLDEVIAKIREPLASSGIGFQQFLTSRGSQYVVRTVIFHKSGQWIGADYPVFYDSKKGAQGFASGVTYARRYGLTLATGLAPEDDDDANVADARPAQIASKPRSVRNAASSTDAQDPARAAYRRLQYSIDEAGKMSPNALRLVYDGALKEWGDPFKDDAELVLGASASGLDTLVERAAYWLQKKVTA